MSAGAALTFAVLLPAPLDQSWHAAWLFAAALVTAAL